MHYVYIHGFNSGPQSRSGSALEALLEKPVFRPRNDYSLGFWDVVHALETQISTQYPRGNLCLMGTSLGGFYALQLRMPRIRQIMAWNPVIYPAIQLGQFVGENTRFTDGEKWEFTREAQLSYASSPNPRQWDNEMWETDSYGGATPNRQIFLGRNDELLDSGIAEAYWNGHAAITWIEAGHHIEDFEHLREIKAIW